MTGPDVPHELRLPCRSQHCSTGTAQRGPRRRVTRRPAEWAFATHKQCPIDGCANPAQVPMRSAAHPPALDHGDPDQNTVPCQRCGTSPYVPAEV
jgi:hypothetical protein